MVRGGRGDGEGGRQWRNSRRRYLSGRLYNLVFVAMFYTSTANIHSPALGTVWETCKLKMLTWFLWFWKDECDCFAASNAMEQDGVSCGSCMSVAISGRGLMLINARSPDWNLLMGPIWWRTGYLISSTCCNSNNKTTFALLHELRMHHVQQ